MIAGKDATVKWPKNMQEWSVGVGGELADAAVDCRTNGDGSESGLTAWLKLGSDETPKDIDFTLLDFGQPLPNRGVYSLDGDVWQVCLPRGTKLERAPTKVQDRPKRLASTEANGAILITLKRVKADQDKTKADKPRKDDAPSYEFRPGNDKESVEVRVEADRTVYVITGGKASGGTIKICLKAGQWPRDVTLRLSKSSFVDTFSVTTDHVYFADTRYFSGSGKMPFVLRNAKGDFDSGGPATGTLNVVIEKTKEGLDFRLPPNLLVGSREVEFFWIVYLK
jgi:hypothetical protein